MSGEKRKEKKEFTAELVEVHRDNGDSEVRLFGAGGEDLLAADIDFDTERGTNVAALDYPAAHPHVSGKIESFHRIVKSAAARIADERMIGLAIVIVRAQLFEVANVFELAVAVGSFA